MAVCRSGRLLAANISLAIAAALLLLICLPAIAVAQARSDPLLRWLYFYEPRAYPNATIPPRALQSALEQYQQQFAPPAAPAGAPAPLETAWTPLGPDHLTFGSSSFSGRVSAIVVDPTDSNTIYVGAAQGGVWKTNDAGTTWVQLTDTQCSLAMGSIAIDPVDPNIIYAGTGEENFAIDSYYGCGVLRSTDRGTTWSQFGASVFDTTIGGAMISRILVDPLTAGSTTSTTLYVTSDLGVYQSLNSGQSWTLRLAGVATDLVMDPSNPDVLYASLGNPFADAKNGVYKSTNGGTSWTKLASGLPTSEVGRVNLAISASSPSTLYAGVQNDFGGSGVSGSLLGIFKTTNGGTSWTQVNNASGASCNTQCWYDMVIAVDPNNPNIVYFGGVELYKSTDGGDNFANIRPALVHVDQHALAFDPQNASVVYVGNDGGVFRSANGGTNWSSLNTNLAITQFYPGISLHPTDANYILGGTQDNGTLRFTGSSVWQEIISGDGGYTAIDFVTPTTVYGENQWTVGSSSNGPRRSDNAGSFVLKNSGIILTDRAAFIPPYVMDPSNSQTLYFGTYRLYKTTNRGDSWTTVAAGADLTMGSGTISTIAVAQSNPQVIYVGATDGNIVVTTNGGSTFGSIISGLPNRSVKAIAVDPTSASTAYVAFSGFDAAGAGTGHVFKTTNFGAHWTNVSANLPDVPVNAILLDPGAPSNIYIGTDLGVFRSTDGGGSWSALNTGLPNVAVFDLVFRSGTNVLVAATHGRGVFKIPVTGTPVLSVTPTSQDFGKVGIGSTADRTFTVQNIGQGTLSGSASTSAPFSVITGGTYSLGAGASQSVVVRFAPGSVGVFSSGVTFTGASSLSRLVSGQGVNTAVLTVSKSGNGSGTVTSSIGGINCGSTCQASITKDTSVTLTAVAATGSVFAGWTGGGCAGTSTCTVTMTANVTITAVFVLNSSPSFAVTVSVKGSAGGTVTSNPAGITNCTAMCSASYISGTPLLLTATSSAGTTFKQWGGACGGAATTCTVTVDAVKSVTATFSKIFTDGSGANETISGQTTVIKVVHVTELRSAIDKLRTVNGLSVFSWTDATLTAGLTVVKRLHFTELRTALSQAYQAAGSAPPTFTDPTINPAVTVIKASHLNELRNNVRALE
jgi:photosystem II stability/assembly factor-like uncharacterized protein